MESTLESDSVTLAAHWSKPKKHMRRVGVIIIHGIPVGSNGGSTFVSSYPELGDRLAEENGVTSLFMLMRGTADSPGEFSISNWRRDIRSAVDAMAALEEIDSIVLVATSMGGVLALDHAASDERVSGLVLISTPASLESWIHNEKQFMNHVRDVGLLHDPSYPGDTKVWMQEFKTLNPLDVNARLKSIPILVLHGSDDQVVPVSAAHEIQKALGENCEKRIIDNAGHRLRYDPRAVATLFGWFDRFGANPPTGALSTNVPSNT
ncbi:MAG TPA: alpha/beta fold hydrolase [Acidimicrobiia bacterium]|nr:alpha/beta fold hydrolase [Acidimicrobiia bacterium]